MRVLVLCDDRWHPAQTARQGLAPLADLGFRFDWIEQAGEWSSERMLAYPVTILTKSNNVSASDETPWMDDSTQAAFRDYVRRGHGLLAIHSGTAGYRACPTLRALLGGVFVQHPAQCQVTVRPQRGHPLTQGSAAFTRQDEHYFMEFDAQDADVYLTTHSEHGEQPAGWTRQEGTGRVAVLTPGHNLEVWLEPAYQTLISNALHWCGRTE